MNFEHSRWVQDLCGRLQAFMDQNVLPVEREYSAYLETTANKWSTPPLMLELQARARAEGLWNLFLPDADLGAGLSNLEYAPLAEIMGQVWWAAEVFNCNAPDTGNMETLYMYGSAAQKERWLKPLLSAEIRSGFAMTEPDVASSDATNIECSIMRDGDEYVINGRKWFTTGAMRDTCEILILMGKTDPDNPDRHKQQSMILVPRNAPGVRIVRYVKTLGYDDAPLGEPEIAFENVRVPAENILLGEGRGFEIAQGRLGPGRIHHCMRLIGGAQRALDKALDYARERQQFGQPIANFQATQFKLADMETELQAARVMLYEAAAKLDAKAPDATRWCAMAKRFVTDTGFKIANDALQIHGGYGYSKEFIVERLYRDAPLLCIGEGTNEIQRLLIAKRLIERNPV